MKFLIINTDYPAFLRWLYEQHPGLEGQPYQEQMRARWESLFGMADFYSFSLGKLGCEAWDIIANIEPAQKQWAREQGVSYSDGIRWRLGFCKGIIPWISHRSDPKKWLYPILAAQVKHYRPDILYSMALEDIGSDFLRTVKDYYRLAIGQHAAPLPGRDISEYNLILSSLPNQVDYFRNQGMRSELFRMGFGTKVLSKLPSDLMKRFDTVFVGGFDYGHQGGNQTLEYLCREGNIKVWGYGIKDLSKDSPIRRAYMGPVWGIKMYQILHHAKVGFNRHIDIAGDYANNMRLFETTGVGTLLITDCKKNLKELFEPGQEVVCYRSPEECAELIRYYLEHDSERGAIARAGQKRTLKEHTYYQRMQELVKIVRRYL